MLGKDAAKSEYWHFKDDNTRIYIRMEEEIPIGQVDQARDNVEMTDENGNAVEGCPEELRIQKESTQVDSVQNRHTPSADQTPVQSMINTCEQSKRQQNESALVEEEVV